MSESDAKNKPDGLITITRRWGEVETYSLADIPTTLVGDLAKHGAACLLRSAVDPQAMWDRLKAGQLSTPRRGNGNSTWKKAAVAVKAKALKKDGHETPVPAADAWWGGLSKKERLALQRLPAVIIEHAKITGKELPAI